MSSFQQYLSPSISLNRMVGFFLAPFGKLPDFLIIGAQKAGTSALVGTLATHPDIYVPDYDHLHVSRSEGWGEVHFFNGPNWNYGINWYSSLFTKNKICGEKTPNYMCSKLAMQRIKSVIPEVKLIVCLRDPVYRFISQVNMHRNRDRRKGIKPVLTISKLLSDPVYIDKGMYYKQIKENILSYFDSSQLYIYVIDEKLEDIDKFREENIIKIQKFLDLPVKDIKTKKSNRNKYFSDFAVSEEEIYQLQQIYRHPNEQLFSFLGREIKSWGTSKNPMYLQ